MAKDTPSMAKNKIKRCLAAILDPHPSPADIDLLWVHFGSACAYCGAELLRNARHGHLDHAVSASAGGTNSIYSHVLACARCNGDEKREETWETFLAKKCGDADTLLQRRQRILEWFATTRGQTRRIDDEAGRQAQSIIDDALVAFDQAVARMRQLRNGV